jgi:hypothetical protein
MSERKRTISVGTQTEDSCLRELAVTKSPTTNNNNMHSSSASAREPFSVMKPARSESKGLTVTFSPMQPTVAAPKEGATASTCNSPAAATKPAAKDSRSKSPRTDSENSTEKDDENYPSQSAIFSPKSAANALTSLFSQSTAKAHPRQCFPSSAPSPSGETSTSSTASIEGMSPPNSSVKSEASVGQSDTSPTQAETPSTAGGSPPQWQHDGMPPSHMKQVPGHPYQQASPPTVYFSTYPHCYADGPQWRHAQYQGPWTPIIGGKIAGGTPHHMRRPPPQAFAWDPSRMAPVMEVSYCGFALYI